MYTEKGIKSNLPSFSMLVLINLFVGSMVGLERTILPIIGEEEFGIASASATLAFIVSFGFSKAVVNLFAGTLSDRIGRKKVLLFGWGVGLFVPILVIFAEAWWVIVFANVLLGLNQGLAWSMTVNMKVDIATPNQRGLAVGFNEFAGYTGVALTAMISGYMASTYSLRPEPFYIGIGIAIVGFLLSLTVQDTSSLVKKDKSKPSINMKKAFLITSWENRSLSTISFAGLATNLKDGMAWGLFPIFFATSTLTVGQIGTIIAIYPAAWGFFQLFTGALSDRIGRKILIVSGMFTQAAALWWILFVDGYALWLIGAVILGIGTAMVYPTLIASISDIAAPEWRASSLGIYRFWRDSGYAFGALIAGVLVDLLSVGWSMGLVAVFPLVAGILAMTRMKESH
ncbi:MFS transporter [Halobacillus locisalis]|uniref:MFS transporter n=1 Tax=Halobacillus locisalis TaxID=220753 RepID=A0A838CV54_9BACI|nr:MFS transporter [Halobacillus locisalis]MBA2176022.1 MFS transporter [Halobacillus locisalis]